MSEPLIGSMEQGYDYIYASIFAPWETGPARYWFQIDADRPDASYPLGSRGLVISVGTDSAIRDATISIAALAARVRFTRRPLRKAPSSIAHSGWLQTGEAPPIDVAVKASV